MLQGLWLGDNWDDHPTELVFLLYEVTSTHYFSQKRHNKTYFPFSVFQTTLWELSRQQQIVVQPQQRYKNSQKWKWKFLLQPCNKRWRIIWHEKEICGGRTWLSFYSTRSRFSPLFLLMAALENMCLLVMKTFPSSQRISLHGRLPPPPQSLLQRQKNACWLPAGC